VSWCTAAHLMIVAAIVRHRLQPRQRRAEGAHDVAQASAAAEAEPVEARFARTRYAILIVPTGFEGGAAEDRFGPGREHGGHFGPLRGWMCGTGNMDAARSLAPRGEADNVLPHVS